MKLPNAENAVVDEIKLAAYCLDMNHRRGVHKARVFRSALGVTADDSPWLREQLLRAARVCEADIGEKTQWGQKYRVDFSIATETGVANVRSAWIVEAGKTSLVSPVATC